METKTTRGYSISMQTVKLQSLVSNLNLLCHLKSPWTNLTLACNNHLEEYLSVVCMWVSVWPQAYLLWSWHWKIMTGHMHTMQEINQNYMQHHVYISAKSMKIHTSTEIRLWDHCDIVILLPKADFHSFILPNKGGTEVWPFVDLNTYGQVFCIRYHHLVTSATKVNEHAKVYQQKVQMSGILSTLYSLNHIHRVKEIKLCKIWNLTNKK